VALRGKEYEARLERLAGEGRYLHGEADLVCALLTEGVSGPVGPVLDAGCGTGRVAIELSRRGVDVVGTDVDRSMLDVARAKAPGLQWIEADLATERFDVRFALVLAAGNVMVFLRPATAPAVVATMGGALVPGGLLLAGFELDARLALEDYDAMCSEHGLTLVDRWATWERAAFDSGPYAVSLHRRAGPS
jgi:SAM-dependent methyltransferase